MHGSRIIVYLETKAPGTRTPDSAVNNTQREAPQSLKRIVVLELFIAFGVEAEQTNNTTTNIDKTKTPPPEARGGTIAHESKVP